MTEEFRVPSDHLESLHFCDSTEISLVRMMNICELNFDPARDQCGKSDSGLVFVQRSTEIK